MSTVSFDFKMLSDQVRDQLLSSSFFSDVPADSGVAIVISEDPHDIVSAINAALNNIGLGLIVLLPVAHSSMPKAGPYFDDVEVVVKIYEVPTINRAATNNGGNNPTAYAAAMMVCALLHRFVPEGVSECFLVRSCIPVNDDQFLIWQVTVKTAAGLNYPLPKIAPVIVSSIDPGNQTVTLSCATPGAAIFYTLDNRYPSARSGTLYTGPIDIAVGQILKARPWLQGYAPATPIDITVQY